MSALSPIDWEKIELYLKTGASPKRVAACYRMDLEKLKKEITERYDEDSEVVIKGFHVLGELLLEATQFQKALAGNVQLLIYLGKIRCGQREPDATPYNAPAQEDIDKDHLIMILKNKVRDLLEKYGNESQAR